jgi:ABC-2 type transport system ATP-binding protein
MDAVMTAQELRYAYGRKAALQGVDLAVQPGEIFGLLGPNGAGKTTFMRLLLDLLRPQSGRLEIFGTTPRAGGAALRRRIGYLPGELRIDGTQRVHEYLDVLAGMRGGEARNEAQALAERLQLDRRARIGSLSKGNRQKVGLVQALMHRPELLVLDEPTSGLDPLVQQEFNALIGEARDRGQTVLLSSHILSEVEQTVERIGVMRNGRLVLTEPLAAMRQRAGTRVTIHFAEAVPTAAFVGLPHISDVQLDDSGQLLHCRLNGSADALLKAAAQFTAERISAAEIPLEELFLALYHEPEGSHAA